MDLALAVAVRDYAGSQYHSGIPYGYLKSSQPRMDGDQATALKARWLEQHGGSTRSIAVLNASTEFVPLSISPLDAQLDNARQWSLRDIAMAFGVPSYMLGVPGDSATYANVESRMIEFRTYTLLPWQRRIESTLDAQFPRGTELKIASSGLERADTASRFNAYKTALDAGFMTRDEVRATENLPPLGPEADPSLPAGVEAVPNMDQGIDSQPETGAA
jgi:HK97 family phage portal protein